jgi:hypothetical protein
MNLVLALIWLVGAIVAFAYPYFTGQPVPLIPLGDTRVSIGWLLLALSLYNWVRWWSIRAYRADQRAQQLAHASRHRLEHWRERREPSGELDPNFDFSDQPPAPPNRNVTDQPPSNN